MAAGDIITARVVGRFQDQNVVNTLHYKIVDQTSSEQVVLDSFCSDWDNAISAGWVARHAALYTLVGVKAFNHTGVPKRPGFMAIGDAGLVVGSEVLAHTCRTITLYTNSAKHRRRGRVMLSGSVQTMFNTTDGSVSLTERVALDVLGTLLMATILENGDSYQLVIPPTAVDPVEEITAVRARITPSVVTTRRIRQFLIG